MNTFIGKEAGYSVTTGWQNTIIGYQAGKNLQSGTGNIFIGYWAGFNETGDRKLYIDNSTTSTPIIYGELTTSPTPRFLRFNASVAIGYTPGSYEIYGLWVNGGTSSQFSMHVLKGATTNGTWNTYSDLRWKRDIQTLEGVSEKLKRVRGVSYFFKTDDYKELQFSERKQIGVIAQELEDVFPELVIVDEQGYRYVSYDKLSAVLLQAIKEQQAEIDELKALKDENQELKARLEKLEKIILEK
jgi:hypothetical protein